jgi:hypothetical protein
MKYWFKKTWCGMVLMIRYRVAIEPVGTWKYYSRKATELEVQEFMCDSTSITQRIK